MVLADVKRCSPLLLVGVVGAFAVSLFPARAASNGSDLTVFATSVGSASDDRSGLAGSVPGELTGPESDPSYSADEVARGTSCCYVGGACIFQGGSCPDGAVSGPCPCPLMAVYSEGT
jgi:hypothetical protein